MVYKFRNSEVSLARTVRCERGIAIYSVQKSGGPDFKNDQRLWGSDPVFRLMKMKMKMKKKMMMMMMMMMMAYTAHS